MSGKILIIDDERDMLTLLKRIISEERDHEIVVETDPSRALSLFQENAFDLVLTDLKMPKVDGIKVLESVKKINPGISVIILTAYATIETAVEAIRKGAYDYITKPFRSERILLTIDKVMQWQAMVKENSALRKALEERKPAPFLIGTSPMMREIAERIRQVAPSSATVLITGPSGSGKELAATAVHQNSLRNTKKLVTVNCTAIPEQVIESELFGHVKGAFTGAWKDKKGLVEEAVEGTLFLDEIGDLSPRMQTKLLRLLQEGEYRAVGSLVTRKADLRFIAATNHNLKAEIKERRFREDLYYRLNVVHIEMPSLKERQKDIPLLSYHFLKKYARINQKNVRGISPEALEALLSQEFPGNVRELENIIERAVIFCRSETLRLEDLHLENDNEIFYPRFTHDITLPSFKEAKERTIHLFHKQYITSLLQESMGNISKAADLAGIQRQYLHRLMKETGVEAEQFKNKPE